MLAAGEIPVVSWLVVGDPDHIRDHEDVTDILRTIELYEDDEDCEDCDGPIIVVETGLDRAEVDEILQYLWRADRMECRSTRTATEVRC